MKKHFAVIGNPIAHSLSPIIHEAFAKQFGIELVYEKLIGNLNYFEAQIIDFFAQGGKGLNVTLPFKERAYALADVKTARCKKARAANTLWMSDGKIFADNTDGAGLLSDITRYQNLLQPPPLSKESVSLKEVNLLILGAGGATRGILEPLLSTHPKTLMLSNRTVEKAWLLQKDFPEIQVCPFENIKGPFHLIINATAASLENTTFPLPKTAFLKDTLFYDLAYNKQQPTAFVQFAKEHGCFGVDGLGMLVEQAAVAFSIWHGVTPEVETVLEELRKKL